MKKALVILCALLLMAGIASAEWVSGYWKSNGTYVNSYYRAPAGTYSDYSSRSYGTKSYGWGDGYGDSYKSWY